MHCTDFLWVPEARRDLQSVGTPRYHRGRTRRSTAADAAAAAGRAGAQHAGVRVGGERPRRVGVRVGVRVRDGRGGKRV
jgi:hypothetical protein